MNDYDFQNFTADNNLNIANNATFSPYTPGSSGFTQNNNDQFFGAQTIKPQMNYNNYNNNINNFNSENQNDPNYPGDIQVKKIKATTLKIKK